MENGGNLRLKLVKDSNKISIDIIDNGIGMTSTEDNRLGTPCYTTNEKGSGLGMMIVFNVIRNMKGEIQINSKKGQGTHFFISFPHYHS